MLLSSSIFRVLFPAVRCLDGDGVDLMFVDWMQQKAVGLLWEWVAGLEIRGCNSEQDITPDIIHFPRNEVAVDVDPVDAPRYVAAAGAYSGRAGQDLFVIPKQAGKFPGGQVEFIVVLY